MRRPALALVVAAAAAALAGCIALPPAPAPPTDPPRPQPTTPAQPSTDPSASSPAPTTPAAGGDLAIDVAGSVATVQSDGTVWELELLAFEAAPLDELAEYPDGGPAPEAPAGMVVAWACMAATLVDSPDGSASVTEILDVEVEGGEDGWDYETVDRDLDVYGASTGVGETIDRTCPILLVPEGETFEAVTFVVENAEYDSVEAAVPTP